jgi:hypothetical protein
MGLRAEDDAPHSISPPECVTVTEKLAEDMPSCWRCELTVCNRGTLWWKVVVVEEVGGSQLPAKEGREHDEVEAGETVVITVMG